MSGFRRLLQWQNNRCRIIISGKVKEDDGAFLTQNLGVVAITIALVAVVLIGMNTISTTAGADPVFWERLKPG